MHMDVLTLMRSAIAESRPTRARLETKIFWSKVVENY